MGSHSFEENAQGPFSARHTHHTSREVSFIKDASKHRVPCVTPEHPYSTKNRKIETKFHRKQPSFPDTQKRRCHAHLRVMHPAHTSFSLDRGNASCNQTCFRDHPLQAPSAARVSHHHSGSSKPDKEQNKLVPSRNLLVHLSSGHHLGQI